MSTQEDKSMRAMQQLVGVAIGVVCCASIALADGPNADVIAKVTGLQPEVKNGVATVRVPRDDLAVVADGVTLTPFQGLTSWAAFEQAGNKTMVMGDLTLTEDQV